MRKSDHLAWESSSGEEAILASLEPGSQFPTGAHHTTRSVS